MDIYIPVEGPRVLAPAAVGQFAARLQTINRLGRLGLGTLLAQYRGIVNTGLIITQHAFQGVKRELFFDGSTHSDKDIVAYAWKHGWDYEFRGDPFNDPPTRLMPPSGKVFVVLISPVTDGRQDIEGYIDHWSWVDESTDLPGAPVGWRDRYERRLWSRPTFGMGVNFYES